MNHAPEPWTFQDNFSDTDLLDSRGGFIATSLGEGGASETENFRRIAASVNFLTGIPTHQIEDIASEGMSLLDLMASVKDWDVAHLRAYLLGEEP